jgi:uncharacterized protein YlxW (UPF0749 family)
MLLKVSGHDALVRDGKSRAIVNTSKEEFNNYIIARNRALEQKNMIEEQQKELQTLKQDVSEIKNLLKQLIEK